MRTHKSNVMCRPSLVRVETEPPPYLCGHADAAPAYSPATVLDRKDIGSVMKYWVKFDDGVVRLAPRASRLAPSRLICHLGGCRSSIQV